MHFYEGYHFWGMHLFWWIIWAALIIWIFATPWAVPGERRKRGKPPRYFAKEICRRRDFHR